MKQGKKIKRYNKIYRGKGRKGDPIKAVAITVGCLALFFIGFSVIGPITEYFKGNIKPNEVSKQPTPVSTQISSGADQVSSEISVAGNDQIKAVYLPANAVKTTAQVDALVKQFQQMGINQVIIELKDNQGNLYYDSAAAKQSGITPDAANLIDLKAIIQKFEAQKIKVGAKLYAFEDNLAAKALADAAVRYAPNTEYVWIDKTGGRRWMNPYAASAQKYLIDLSTELAAMGCNQIVLASVQFPNGEALNMTDFGTEASKKTKTQVLKDFIAKAEQELKAKNVKLLVEMPSSAVLTEQTFQYGGSILALGASDLLLDLRAGEFARNLKVGETVIADPTADPAKTVDSVLTEVQKQVKQAGYTGEVIPILSADKMTAQQLTDQQAAAEKHELKSYLLYQTNGTY